MIFVGCSTRIEYVPIPSPTPVPSSLVQHPKCGSLEVGERTDSLVSAFARSKTCIKNYKSVVDGIKFYNEGLKSGKATDSLE